MYRRYLFAVLGMVLFVTIVISISKMFTGGFSTEVVAISDPTADTSVESLTALGQSMKAMEERLNAERAAQDASDEEHQKLILDRDQVIQALKTDQATKDRQWNQTLTSLKSELSSITQHSEQQGKKFYETVQRLIGEQKRSDKQDIKEIPVKTTQRLTGPDGLVWVKPTFAIPLEEQAPRNATTQYKDPIQGHLSSYKPAGQPTRIAGAMNDVIKATDGIRKIVSPDAGLKPTLRVRANASSATEVQSDKAELSASPRELRVPETKVPVYTIDANFTLYDAKAMSALIGRVPIGGSVRYPLRFKVLLGKKNLAANGIEIPGIKESVWSGYAYGDRTLRCVRGIVDTASFIFLDGRIVTQRSSNREQKNAGSDAFNDAGALGWISDAHGNCIEGEYITNAPDNLAKMFAAGFASGVSRAASLRQQSFSVSGSGVTGAVDGSASSFVAAEGVVGGFDAFSEYLSERAREDFDVVVAPSGGQVVINVTNQVSVDYDVNARKVSYYEDDIENDAIEQLD